MKQLKNKNVVITGAASGIGKATALAFAKQGCNIVLADLSSSTEVENTIKAMGQQAISYSFDVSDIDQYRQFVDEVSTWNGGIDILINNAGFMQGGAVQDCSLEQWHKITDVNIHGPFYGIHLFLPHLLKKREAHIVNTASLFGLAHLPFVASYCMSKAAVIAFSNSLRSELQHQGIGVTVACPGSVQTNLVTNGSWHASSAGNMIPDMFDQHKSSTPEAVADAIVKGVIKNKRQVLIGSDAQSLSRLMRFIPDILYRSFCKFAEKTAAS